MPQETDAQFYDRADAHIPLSNEQITNDVGLAKVSASMLCAASRFNAWVSAALSPVLLSMPATVAAQSGAVSLLGEGRDGVMKNWEVSPEKWRSQPKWNPSAPGAAPLSLQRAIALAEAWLRKQHTDISKLAVSQITLRSQSESGAGIEDGWFYRIEFRPVVAGRKAWGAELVAVVLFDGTVVVPRTEPYTMPRK